MGISSPHVTTRAPRDHSQLFIAGGWRLSSRGEEEKPPGGQSSLATRLATWQAAVAADRNERSQSNATVSGVKQSLQVMFAGSVDTLADFGLTPRKPHVVSPGAKVAAAAKAKATREARHTQGTKQKAAIKGSLDGVNLVVRAQVPAPSASPTVAASPTPTAPAAGSGIATPVSSK